MPRRVDFHIRLKELMTRSNISVRQLASEAGMLAATVRAILEGEAGVTADLYDAAVHRWRALRSYPRPVVLQRTPMTLHPQAAAERTRLLPLQNASRPLQRFSTKNRQLIKEFAKMFKEGDYSTDDMDYTVG